MANIVVKICVILAVLSGVVVEAGAFRCGGELVSIGTSKAKVLLICGEPTRKEKGAAAPKVSRKARSRHQANDGEDGGKGERWYYNCGANDFIYVLTFAGGKLESEQTEGYGSGPGNCGGD